jgi:hypothetical protein
VREVQSQRLLNESERARAVRLAYHKAYSKKYYERHKAKLIARSKEFHEKQKIRANRTTRLGHLRRKYGLTAEQHEAILQSQHGMCALCQLRRATEVDHCHETGAVRSMLCRSCNSGLGMFMEWPELLRRAAEYLHDHRVRAKVVA